MKRNLLLVMNSLTSGGAEKSLISLLQLINYSLYNVDLLLFKHEGLFLDNIPKQVNLLKQPAEYSYFDMSIRTAVFDCIRSGKFEVALSRVKAGYIFKTESVKGRIGQRVWKHISKSVGPLTKQYDAAIGYLEGYPIYFCIDNVRNASKKIGFVHTDYDKLGWDNKIDSYYFKQLDYIVTVSEECSNILKRRFPIYKDKIKVMYNIVSPDTIRRMSQQKVDFKQSGIKIVSVGRLSYIKGFDLAIEACKSIIDQGYNLSWYIIGEGEEREKLEKLVEEKQLKDKIVFLGVKENPYPYISEADIYVQPSRVEGKSIAIDEAKILRKPIVVTNFESVHDQIIDEQNGLIVDINAHSIADGIRRLIENGKLRDNLIQNLSKEQLGTESEINKLYQFID